MKKIIDFFKIKDMSKFQHNQSSMLYENNNVIWMQRNYEDFANEAYIKNVIANRSINIIAEGAASAGWLLHECTSEARELVKSHQILDLLHMPNVKTAGAEFFAKLISFKMISGNCFVLALNNLHGEPTELHILRPDRVNINVNDFGDIVGYEYDLHGEKQYFAVDPFTGESDILHIKNFHPLDDYYGLSQIEASAYSIDIHNSSSIWNKSMLQNGARPSGALILKGVNGEFAGLNNEQYERLREQVDECYSGGQNSGRPLLLEGGLEWKEMSLSPKDMDFLESKNSTSRDIALSFGVPPQLLGIKGDNTYSNMVEARLALWEETILPLLDHLCDSLNNWLIPRYGNKNLKLSIDKESISALTPRRDSLWQRVKDADFLDDEEKREILGFSRK